MGSRRPPRPDRPARRGRLNRARPISGQPAAEFRPVKVSDDRSGAAPAARGGDPISLSPGRAGASKGVQFRHVVDEFQPFNGRFSHKICCDIYMFKRHLMAQLLDALELGRERFDCVQGQSAPYRYRHLRAGKPAYRLANQTRPWRCPHRYACDLPDKANPLATPERVPRQLQSGRRLRGARFPSAGPLGSTLPAAPTTPGARRPLDTVIGDRERNESDARSIATLERDRRFRKRTSESALKGALGLRPCGQNPCP